MDTFELGLGYASEEEALRRIRSKVLLVGISSDWLFPAADVRRLLARLRAAGVHGGYIELVSDHGHDGFLADTHLLAPLLSAALKVQQPKLPRQNYQSGSRSGLPARP
jgi:homoserine O-acetyltransferase